MNNEKNEKKLCIGIRGETGQLEKYVFGDTIDELINGLEVLKDGKLINRFIENFPNLAEEQLMRLDVIMAQTEDAEQIYNYAIKRKTIKKEENLQKLQDIFIDKIEVLKDGKLINRFIESFPNLAEEQLIRLDVIMAQTEIAEQIYNYASRRKKISNISDLEDALIKAELSKGRTDFIEAFEKNIKGADLLKAKNAILESNKVWYIIDFFITFQNVEGCINSEDIKRAEEIIISNCRIEPIIQLIDRSKAIIKFANSVDGANIESIENRIISIGDKYQMKEFAENVEKANLDKFKKASKNMHSLKEKLEWRATIRQIQKNKK